MFKTPNTLEKLVDTYAAARFKENTYDMSNPAKISSMSEVTDSVPTF